MESKSASETETMELFQAAWDCPNAMMRRIVLSIFLVRDVDFLFGV